MTSAAQTRVDRSIERLAAAFNRRRCWCGEPARAIRPGFPPDIEDNQIVRPAMPSRSFCLRHAFRAYAVSAAG